jgi:hypothetical protein
MGGENTASLDDRLKYLKSRGGGSSCAGFNVRFRLSKEALRNPEPETSECASWMRLRAILPPWPTSRRSRALLDQGCDLESDMVPIVAVTCPTCPLKNWGAALACPRNPCRP